MKVYKNSSNCKAMVECEVHDPYDTPGSVMENIPCIKVNILGKICRNILLLRPCHLIGPFSLSKKSSCSRKARRRNLLSSRGKIMFVFVVSCVFLFANFIAQEMKNHVSLILRNSHF